MMHEQCPMACGLCNANGGWLTESPTPEPTSMCIHPVDHRSECPTWTSLGFCNDLNAHLAEYMALQCPLSCGFGGCPTAAPTTMPTPAPIDVPTSHPSARPTTSAPTTSAPSPAPTTSGPTTSAPSQQPTVPLGRLAIANSPAAVSAFDALWFDITIDWVTDPSLGPIELVSRYALREAFSEARASNQNILSEGPILLGTPVCPADLFLGCGTRSDEDCDTGTHALDGVHQNIYDVCSTRCCVQHPSCGCSQDSTPSATTVITLRLKWELLPLPAGV